MSTNSTIKPLTLGSLTLKNNLVQGPLAGYSASPFREIMSIYGSVGCCYTEMISANDLIHRTQNNRRYWHRGDREEITAYQLSGNDPEVLKQAVEIVEPVADIIDLNCGCPVKKIRKKGCGTKLLTDPEELYRLVSTMRGQTDKPLSIKIRVSKTHHDHCTRSVIEAAESAGVDFITVHGRHWTERYDIPCDYDSIREIKNMARVPVIANGDIEDAQSLLTCATHTGCDGYMIARAGVGQPWLFDEIIAEMNGEPFNPPNPEARGNILLEHINGLIALEGEHRAILQSRKLAKYYSRGLPERPLFVEAMQSVKTFTQAKAAITTFFH